jgi:hypothetical protein
MTHGDYFFDRLLQDGADMLTGDCLRDVQNLLLNIVWESPMQSQRCYAAALVNTYLKYVNMAKNADDMERLSAKWLKEVIQ